MWFTLRDVRSTVVARPWTASNPTCAQIGVRTATEVGAGRIGCAYWAAGSKSRVRLAARSRSGARDRSACEPKPPRGLVAARSAMIPVATTGRRCFDEMVVSWSIGTPSNAELVNGMLDSGPTCRWTTRCPRRHWREGTVPHLKLDSLTPSPPNERSSLAQVLLPLLARLRIRRPNAIGAAENQEVCPRRWSRSTAD